MKRSKDEIDEEINNPFDSRIMRAIFRFYRTHPYLWSVIISMIASGITTAIVKLFYPMLSK